MSMGMSYQDYWYGDVFMVVPYVEAYRLRKRQENERLWLQGMYFYDALSVALKRFGDGLGGQRTPDSVKYPEEPYRLYQATKEKTQDELQEQEDAETRRARAYMMQMDAAFKRRQEKR